MSLNICHGLLFIAKLSKTLKKLLLLNIKFLVNIFSENNKFYDEININEIEDFENF